MPRARVGVAFAGTIWPMATPSSAPDEPRLQGGELLAAISNQMVRLLRDATGRGPTQCKTFWAGDEMILVQIKGGYSAAEHTLAEAGHEDEVHSSRRALQDSIEEDMRSIVESQVGRPVVAFMSNTHMDPDMMIEVFALGPES